MPTSPTPENRALGAVRRALRDKGFIADPDIEPILNLYTTTSDPEVKNHCDHCRSADPAVAVDHLRALRDLLSPEKPG